VNAAIQSSSSRAQDAAPTKHRQPVQRRKEEKRKIAAIESNGENDPFSSVVDPFGESGGGGGSGARAIGKKSDPFASSDPFGQGAGGATMQLHQCPDCGRKFNPKSFEKHVKNCKKVFSTKRKTFNMKVRH
jgi:hypothetical protein